MFFQIFSVFLYRFVMYLYLCPPSCSCNQILRLTRKIFFLCYGIIVSTKTCNLPYCCYTTLLFPSVKGSSFQADFLEALVTIQNSSSCSLLQMHYCGRPRVAPNHIIARQCYCLYVLGFPYVAENKIRYFLSKIVKIRAVSQKKWLQVR